MVKSLIIAALAVAGALAGCTEVETCQQRNQRLSRVVNIESRQMVQDLDAILLLDRESNLAQWYTRGGY
ncbi:MAG: hypothetical protein WC869_07170 [Phycisphaerae bacterium]|jgi:hypothetical protein